MLQEAGPGGTILLVTDGKNSPGYHDICDIQPDIVAAGIRVITIAFGWDAFILGLLKFHLIICVSTGMKRTRILRNWPI